VPVREGLLLGRTLVPIITIARRLGLDDAHFRRAGIEPERLASLDDMVPSRSIYALLETIAPHVDFEPFAIAVATATNPSDMGALGLALRAAPTGREALALFVRYQQVVNTVANFHLLASAGEVALTEDRCGPDGLGRTLASEITAMTAIHTARLVFGRQAVARRATIPRHGRFPSYAAWAGCPVTGGAPRASVAFDEAPLDQPLARSDEELWRFFVDLLAARAGPPSTPLVHELRRELASALFEGAPALSAMARRLGKTPRTLQRQLAAEGRSYSAVVDELRHELALAHLGRGVLGIAEIAFALGFDEVASFHRAFRRWERTTPAAFRAARARD